MKKMEDLSKYGKDIISDMEKKLSDELAREIDKEILRNLGFEPDKWKRRKKSIEKIFKQ